MDIHGRVTLDHFGTCYGPGPFKLTNLQPTRSFKCPWLPPPGKVDVFAEGQTSGSLQLRLQSVTLERCRWNIRIANANLLHLQRWNADPKHKFDDEGYGQEVLRSPTKTDPTNKSLSIRWPFPETETSHGTSIARCDRRP